jgi:hypothetical protein
VSKQAAKVGEIREWLKPRGYTGQFHRFMVVEIKKSDWSGKMFCNIMYPDGYIQEIWESDLFQDPDDPEDDEYSVCIDEVADEAQDGDDQDRILQG